MIATLLLSLAPMVSLPIPDRPQAPESPPSGWCGETAIQEGLLHLGVWASQRAIHKAGNSKHPDLYSNELPTALTALSVQTSTYVPNAKDAKGYAAWVRAAIDAGDPVIAGVKLLPSEHPMWGLDHFVLVVGYGEPGLLVNTTWGRQEWASELSTKGISFAKAFYAIRLEGVPLPKGALAARLKVLTETPASVTLSIACVGLGSGDAFRIEKRKAATDAKGEIVSSPVTLDPASTARFHCVRSAT